MFLCRKFFSKHIYITLIVLLSLFSFVACDKTIATDNSNGSEESTADLSPTGLSDGMISPPQIMYQGKIYEYRFSGKRSGLLDDFKEVGTILSVNDHEIPSQDLCAGGKEMHFAQGQRVYASESDRTKIAVYCDDGYYMFYCDNVE